MLYLLELGWELLTWSLDQAEAACSPVLGGLFGGLAGAVCGAVGCATVKLLLGGPASAYEFLWAEWALVGAAMLGYPAGVVLGVHHVGRSRGYIGTRWFAVSGACAGACLGLGLYVGCRWANPSFFDLPVGILPILVILLPTVLIPSLAALGYGFGPLFRRAKRATEPIGSEQSILPVTKAASKAGAGGYLSSAPSSARDFRECAVCGAVNPAESDFCGECGALMGLSPRRGSSRRHDRGSP